MPLNLPKDYNDIPIYMLTWPLQNGPIDRLLTILSKNSLFVDFFTLRNQSFVIFDHLSVACGIEVCAL